MDSFLSFTNERLNDMLNHSCALGSAQTIRRKLRL